MCLHLTYTGEVVLQAFQLYFLFVLLFLMSNDYNFNAQSFINTLHDTS